MAYLEGYQICGQGLKWLEIYVKDCFLIALRPFYNPTGHRSGDFFYSSMMLQGARQGSCCLLTLRFKVEWTLIWTARCLSVLGSVVTWSYSGGMELNFLYTMPFFRCPFPDVIRGITLVRALRGS